MIYFYEIFTIFMEIIFNELEKLFYSKKSIYLSDEKFQLTSFINFCADFSDLIIVNFYEIRKIFIAMNYLFQVLF